MELTKTKIPFLLIWAEIMIFLFTGMGWADSHAIVPGYLVNGDGSSWKQADVQGGPGALNEIPSVLTRGDIYYFADGILDIKLLNGYRCNTPADGDKTITFRKALPEDHGPDIGWDDSMGIGQTVFQNSSGGYNTIFSIQTPYWVIDGAKGSGPDIAGYGFIIQFTFPTPVNGGTFLVWDEWNANAVSDHTDFLHTAFICCGETYNHPQFALEGLGDSITIAHCFFADASVFLHSLGNHLLVEHSYFKDNWSSGQNHGASINSPGDDYVIRNCVFENASNGTGCLEIIKLHVNGDVRNWLICNNVFFRGNNKVFVTQTSLDYSGMSEWKVFNNTFVDVNGGFYNPNYGSGNLFFNNICYNAYFGTHTESYSKGCTFGYSYYNNNPVAPPANEIGNVISSEPVNELFVNYTDNDFRLTEASDCIDKGVDLSSYFAVDKSNIPRPQGLAWDMGAYEYIPVQTQTLMLNTGWNWISFNVLPADRSLDSIFGGILAQVEQVRTQTQSVLRLNGQWVGDLTNMDGIQAGMMFKVRVNTACTLTVSGTAIAVNIPIQLVGGWNWVAFYPSISLSLITSLSSIAGLAEQVRSQTQSAIYSNGQWIGDLAQMEPGKGYTIRMSVPGALIYTEGP